MKAPSLRRLAGAVLGIAAAFSAQAATTTSSFYITFDYGSGLSQYALVTNSFTGAVGDTFVDDYFFNSPPPYADVKASFFSNLLVGGDPQISFSDLTLSIFQPGVEVPFLPLTLSASPISVSGASRTAVPSGIYVFEVSGTLLVPNAEYAGILNADVAPIPVPEPTSALMLVAGLAGIGGVASRRRRQTATA